MRITCSTVRPGQDPNGVLREASNKLLIDWRQAVQPWKALTLLKGTIAQRALKLLGSS